MPRGGEEAAGAKRTSFNRAPEERRDSSDFCERLRGHDAQVLRQYLVVSADSRLSCMHFHEAERLQHKMTPDQSNGSTSGPRHNDNDNWKMAELTLLDRTDRPAAARMHALTDRRPWNIIRNATNVEFKCLAISIPVPIHSPLFPSSSAGATKAASSESAQGSAKWLFPGCVN